MFVPERWVRCSAWNVVRRPSCNSTFLPSQIKELRRCGCRSRDRSPSAGRDGDRCGGGRTTANGARASYRVSPSCERDRSLGGAPAKPLRAPRRGRAANQGNSSPARACLANIDDYVRASDLRGLSRADPSEQNQRARLLPWVLASKRSSGGSAIEFSLGRANPFRHQASLISRGP
jgi:hypothetical protein